MTAHDWFVLVNPNAGAKGVPATDVRAAFHDASIGAEVHETRSPEDMKAMVATAISEGQRRFTVVGGDGSAHLAVNAMMETTRDNNERVSLAIVSNGSGSDFVRTFGHRRGLDAGIARLRNPEIYPVDVGSISGSFGERYFLNAVNVGVAAASAKRAATFPRRIGSVRYVAGFWVALAGFPQAHISVAIDHHKFQGEAINVVVANGQFFGGGMNIAPRATLTDGLFDVQVFKGPRRRAFSVMPRVMRGTHLSHKAVRRYIGADIRIDAPEDWPVEADGEILGTGPVLIGIIPAAIDFIA